MSHQTLKALNDVVPGHQGQFPPVVVKFCDALYNLSVQKKPVLPQNSEVARQHICAYLAAEKYHERMDMTTPSLNMIPVPPKVATRVLEDFRNNLLGEISTPSSSPVSTPRKKNQTNLTSGRSYSPSATPSGSPRHVRVTTPHKSSPLKRLRDAATEEDDPQTTKKRSLEALRDADSPFNPKHKLPVAAKRDMNSPTPPILDESAYKAQYRSEKRQMSLSEFVALCNHFYIPANITSQMIQTFVAQRHRYAKKSEWLLGCGMVHAAYTRINHRLLRLKIGALGMFQNQLFQYQIGGLARWNMLLWCNIVENTVREEPWIGEIEKIYVYNNAHSEKEVRLRELGAHTASEWKLMRRFGSMIEAADIEKQEKYYNLWTSRAKEMVGIQQK